MKERVVENLNRAITALMKEDDKVFFLGEDILDPYGGAFKVSRGLSTQFPNRTIPTPISELGILGVANGLALAGQKPIVELMFGDFIFLAFDQIVNFAAKSVTMYGHEFPYNLLVRCPTGGNRGYGPTHSQSVQKHFIGVPNLDLFELSPLHDNNTLLPALMDRGNPGIHFENKVLYAQFQYADGEIDDLFSYDFLDEKRYFARTFIEEDPEEAVVILSTGGMFNFCLEAARELFMEHELETQIVVPYQLYPFDVNPVKDLLLKAQAVFVVEESTAGGTWGAELTATIYRQLEGLFNKPIHLIHSKDSIIPSARHLENEVLVQPKHIVDAVSKCLSYA